MEKRRQQEREKRGEDCSVVIVFHSYGPLSERVQAAMELGRCVPIRYPHFRGWYVQVLLELDLKMCPYKRGVLHSMEVEHPHLNAIHVLMCLHVHIHICTQGAGTTLLHTKLTYIHVHVSHTFNHMYTCTCMYNTYTIYYIISH